MKAPEAKKRTRNELHIRVNARQKARLMAEAKAAGVSLSTWVREAALKVCGPIAPRLPVELHAMIATDRITIAGIPAPDAPVAIPPVTPKTRRCTGCGDDPMLVARDRDGRRVCGRCKRGVT